MAKKIYYLSSSGGRVSSVGKKRINPYSKREEEQFTYSNGKTYWFDKIDKEIFIRAKLRDN